MVRKNVNTGEKKSEDAEKSRKEGNNEHENNSVILKKTSVEKCVKM